MPNTNVIGYAEFGEWYDKYRISVLEPALATASTTLGFVLNDSLTDRDLTRIRRTSGRVKSKRRAWRKIRFAASDGTIGSVDNIPNHIGDLIGLRITCTNLRDVDMVQTALDALPSPHNFESGLAMDRTSERDYIVDPKQSGYRGWHVEMAVMIETDEHQLAVPCELQIRTLLQDSWGELTHEDTYSKDGALPPLVEVLSKRMADLFATLDDIAEDLRSELDRIDEVSIGDGLIIGHAREDQFDLVPEQRADAASFLSDQWVKLDRPTTLSSLAWLLQHEFGAEITEDWFGQRSFKRFLRFALPDAEISAGSTAYLMPADAVEADSSADNGGVAPSTAEQLRRIDRGLPLIDTNDWANLFAQMAAAWADLGYLEPSARAINQLTRRSRDLARAAGVRVSRRHLDYVAKAITQGEQLTAPMRSSEIAAKFTEVVLQRMTELRLLDPNKSDQTAPIYTWLGTKI